MCIITHGCETKPCAHDATICNGELNARGWYIQTVCDFLHMVCSPQTCVMNTQLAHRAKTNGVWWPILCTPSSSGVCGINLILSDKNFRQLWKDTKQNQSGGNYKLHAVLNYHIRTRVGKQLIRTSALANWTENPYWHMWFEFILGYLVKFWKKKLWTSSEVLKKKTSVGNYHIWVHEHTKT